MSNYLCEQSEIYLYSKYSKEFFANEEDKLLIHVNSTMDIPKNNYSCFVLIKYKDEIIDTLIQVVNNNENKISFLKNIKNKIKYSNLDYLKDFSIKVFIIEDVVDNRVVYNKLKKEFCILNSKLEFKPNDETIIAYIDKNMKYIFSTLIVSLMLIHVNKLNSLGILMNFLSLDILTVVFNITLLNLFVIISCIFIIPPLIISIFGLIIENTFDKTSCVKYKINSNKSIIKILRLLLIPFFIFIILEFYNLIIKNDRDFISDNIVKSYIKQTREPSLIKIKLKNDKDEKTILLMGKDTKFIYFLNKDDIKTEKTKLQIMNNICNNKNILTSTGELSYIDALISLLHIKGEKSNINYIANQRYKNVKISEVTFLEELPNFDKTFCKDDENVINSNN